VKRNIQITTAGHKPSLSAVVLAFEDRRIDFAMLPNDYRAEPP
jgi:hypothetical protein